MEMSLEVLKALERLLDKKGQTQISSIIKCIGEENDSLIIEVLDDLLENVDGKEDPYQKSSYFVGIGDELFKTFGLLRIKKHDYWDENRGTERFGIIINPEPLPAGAEWYLNTVINFSSEDERNKELIRVKNTLSNNTNIKFI